MKLILFRHPAFMSSNSAPRFAEMLAKAFEHRGFEVQQWQPQPVLRKFLRRGTVAKWAGYFDQYVFFPRWVAARLAAQPPDTLYVFCDQAMGPWIGLVRKRPHVVHVHDLLALRSALGLVPQNPTEFTGRVYQRYIRRGFKKARHFISVSNKTRHDLQEFGEVQATSSDVVYNGMNFAYQRLPLAEAIRILQPLGLEQASAGILLHIGGGQWYKNLPGIVELYASYASQCERPLPLWCVSPPPSRAVRSALEKVPPHGNVRFMQGLSTPALQALYSVARAFLFPSLDEGFGWPLIEAQACGCPVVTTDAPPMNEVAGDAAVYLPALQPGTDRAQWAAHAARQLLALLNEDDGQRTQRRDRCIEWARGFDAEKAISQYLVIYNKVYESDRAIS